MKNLLTLLLALLLYGSLTAQTPAPYQDVQANASIQPLVSQDHKDYTLWYIISAFGSAIAFLATMYVRTHGQLIAEKDKSLQREIDRSKEEKQYDSAYEAHVKELMQKQQMQLDGITDNVKSMAENISQIRMDLNHISRTQQ